MALKSEKIKAVEQYLAVKEVASILSISEGHVYMMLRTGLIRGIDISCSGNGGSNSIRISLKSVIEFQRNRTIEPEKKYEETNFFSSAAGGDS